MDPDPNGKATDYSATIWWGDGTSSAGTIKPGSGGFEVHAAHTFANPGPYTFTVSIHDEGGSSVGAGAHATVVYPPELPFIAQLYRDLLHREADLAGLWYWDALLTHGSSRTQVVQSIQSSPEYAGARVQDLYQHYLHRTADARGLAAFSSFLQSGGSVTQVAVALAGSAEYFQIRGGASADGFLQALFVDALDRSIEPAALGVWKQALAAGLSRGQIAAGVLDSGESLQRLGQTFYQQFLHRLDNADDLNALVGVLRRRDGPERIVAALLASDEYFALSYRR